MVTLAEGEGPVTFSYSDSISVLLSSLFECSRAAMSFALVLLKMIVIAVIEATVLISRAVDRKTIDAIYALLVSDLGTMLKYSMGQKISVFTLMGSLAFPVMFPHTVCTANVHKLLLVVGTSVQVALVWLVVVGQLPQFDSRML